MFKMRAIAFATLAAAALASSSALASDSDKDGDDFKFDLVRSKGLANSPTVAPHAHGRVKIESVGPVDYRKTPGDLGQLLGALTLLQTEEPYPFHLRQRGKLAERN